MRMKNDNFTPIEPVVHTNTKEKRYAALSSLAPGHPLSLRAPLLTYPFNVQSTYYYPPRQ